MAPITNCTQFLQPYLLLNLDDIVEGFHALIFGLQFYLNQFIHNKLEDNWCDRCSKPAGQGADSRNTERPRDLNGFSQRFPRIFPNGNSFHRHIRICTLRISRITGVRALGELTVTMRMANIFKGVHIREKCDNITNEHRRQQNKISRAQLFVHPDSQPHGAVS